MIKECIKGLDNEIYIPSEKLLFNKKTLSVTKGGIESESENEISEDIRTFDRFKLPDIITYLQNETNLTRRSIVKILTGSKTLESFRKNPQYYLEQVSEIIKSTMKNFIIDGIKYEKIGDTEYYSQELFEDSEIYGYLKSELSKGNIVETKKTPYDSIVVDSETESKFAENLEKYGNVIVYAKLPSWFKIATPLGNYNPDWAILAKPDINKEEEKLYFVIETKGSKNKNDRRDSENGKIRCGEKHFEAISKEINYDVCKTGEDFKNIL